MSTQPTILMVDDEVRGLESLVRIREDDFDVRTVTDTRGGKDPRQRLGADYSLRSAHVRDHRGGVPQAGARQVARGDSRDHLWLRRFGRHHQRHQRWRGEQCITKPWHPDNLILTLKNAARLFQLQRENELLSVEAPQALGKKVAHGRATLRQQYQQDDSMVRSEHSVMNTVCDHIKRIAVYDISVLRYGESGTGKELTARFLHYNSPRWDKPFVVENCGAVFLDEIGEVSPAIQVMLLRVLQEGEFRPLGSGQTRKVDVRVVVATAHQDLKEEVRAGRFRQDLYDRFASMTITLPPLREPAEHVAALQALLEQAQAARILRETLIRKCWNKSRAAKVRGLTRIGLRSKLERYGLEQVESITLPESGTVN